MAITDKPIIAFHPETFDDLEEERAHRKAKLAGALRVFGRLGFGEGVPEAGVAVAQGARHVLVRETPEVEAHEGKVEGQAFVAPLRHVVVLEPVLQ